MKSRWNRLPIKIISSRTDVNLFNLLGPPGLFEEELNSARSNPQLFLTAARTADNIEDTIGTDAHQ